MRKSNKEAALTRKAIVAAAADHIRGAGIVEASVANVMTAAGLTHGGFYRHFRNKEQLVGLQPEDEESRSRWGGGWLSVDLPPRRANAHVPICRLRQRDRPGRPRNQSRGLGDPQEGFRRSR
jgi:Bacterial regulatory proteins, tetR family